MAQNRPTSFFDEAVVLTRQPEVPLADFFGGMNRGGSCSPGMGINTGDYDPKDSDWWPTPKPRNAESGYLGYLSGANNAVTAQDPTDGEWKNAVFIESVAPVAPLGIIGTIFGNDVINHTDKTIPTGVIVWGIRDTG